MTLSANAGGAKAAEAHLHFLPWLLFNVRWPQALRGPASVSRSRIERLEPPNPWGLIGVGRVSRVTPSSVFATGGAELTTLASTT